MGQYTWRHSVGYMLGSYPIALNCTNSYVSVGLVNDISIAVRNKLRPKIRRCAEAQELQRTHGTVMPWFNIKKLVK